MGIRFRRGINFEKVVRINISKSGIEYSWGVKGDCVTKTAGGSTRKTVSIPGPSVSCAEETRKEKDAVKPMPQSFYNNTRGTQKSANGSDTGIVSNGIEDVLSVARRTLRINRISTSLSVLFMLLCVVNGFYIFPCIAFCFFKLYIEIKGIIDLEYTIDDDQREIIAQRLEAVIKVTDCGRVWRITQTSQVINEKYSGGASYSVNRVLCRASKYPPYPFKANVPVATFEAGNETFIFLPDKLLIMQETQFFALDYSDISMFFHTTYFNESGEVPKDTKIVEYTWKYINKSGGPDKRFKENWQIPVCLYGELELKSTSGLNTTIMFSNPNIQ